MIKYVLLSVIFAANFMKLSLLRKQSKAILTELLESNKRKQRHANVLKDCKMKMGYKKTRIETNLVVRLTEFNSTNKLCSQRCLT